MIAVSENFKTAMKQPTKELDAYIKITETNKITSSDDLISIKISCDTAMCKTAMRKLDAKFLGSHNLLNKWVHVCFGVKVDDGTFEYLDYGSFLISETKTSKDTGVTEIVGYDKMISTMTTYTKLNIDYPIGLYDYTKKICETCGITLANTTFTHADWPVQEDLWLNISGITYRDILAQVCQVTGTTCIISNDDKVYFKTIYDTNETLTYDNMKTLKLEPLYGPINSIVLSRTPQEDNIYMKDEESIKTNGLTEFKIENNQFIDKDRRNAMRPIYNALLGINYYPFKTSTEGLGWYEIGDSFKIINDLGEEFYTVLFNFSITIDGGIKETLKTSAVSKTKTQYEYASTIAKSIKNTELIVDKQKQRIEALIKQTENLIDYIDVIKDKNVDYTTLPNTPKSNGAINKLSITGFIPVELALGMAYLNRRTNLKSLKFYTIIFSNRKIVQRPILPTPNENRVNQLYLTDKFYECVKKDNQYVWEEQKNPSDVKKITFNSPVVLQKATLDGIEYFDEMRFENNRLKIIQRTNLGTVLENPIIHDLGVFELPTFETDTYVMVKYFYGLNFETKYLKENDFTSVFATQAEMISQIEMLINQITLKVSQAEYEAQLKLTKDSIATKVSNTTYQSDIEQLANEISTKVSSKTFSSSISQLTNIIETKVSSTTFNSSITQLTNKIETKVSSSDVSSMITQYDKELSATIVKKGQVVSAINLSEETIKISANKIKLEGLVTANNNVKFLTDGTIIANGGKIGGFTITSSTLRGYVKDAKGNNLYRAGLYASDDATAGTYAFAVHDYVNNEYPFGVTYSGSLQATKGNIGGWTINKDRLTNGSVFIKNNGVSTVYTVADLLVMRLSILDPINFRMSQDMIKHYDFNNDGEVDTQDYIHLKNLIGMSFK